MKRVVFVSFFFIFAGIAMAHIPVKEPFSKKMESRIREVAKMLPEKPKGFGPTYHDRDAWKHFAKRYDVELILSKAEEIRGSEMPAWDDEAYLEFSRNGVRPPGEKMINRRKSRLFYLVWAECIENSGKYIPAIEYTLRELISHPSWVLPAHDRKLDNFYGRRYHVDLVASLFAQDLGQVLYMLDDKLSSAVKRAVVDSIYSRVFIPTRETLETGRGNNTWIHRTDNWNSVCLNGVTGAALFLIKNVYERAYYVVAAEYYSRNSILGFTDDGYCTEGLGYFNYGFSNYIVLREELYQSTGGKIDLFKGDKIKRIAMYGVNFEIQNGVYPAFADCKIGTSVMPYILWYCNRNLGLGLDKYEKEPVVEKQIEPIFAPVVMRSFPNTASISVKKNGRKKVDLLRQYFDRAGVLISRHAESDGTISVALKGGNNAENHNHNDLGTFVVVKGQEMLIGDAGGPYNYAGDMWTDKRYTFKTLSSYGHPVPCLDGVCQRAGQEALARVTKTVFTDRQDEFFLDLTSAYPVDGLKSLTRSFTYNRSGKGSLIVEDNFDCKTPRLYESALITFGRWTLTEDNCIEIEGENERVTVKVETPKNCHFSVTSEKLQENGPEMTRIAIKLNKKIEKGTIKLVIK